MSLQQIGVVIARCQVPELHRGHLALLADVSRRHKRLVIMLGVAKVPNTTLNPLDYQTRVQMMRKHCPEAVFYPLFDMPNDDAGWSRQVDTALHALYPTGSFVLYGGPDSFLPSYSGRWPKVEIDRAAETHRGTQIRAQCAIETIDQAAFRAGIIAASQNRFQPVHAVVDLAILKHRDHCSADEPCSPQVLMGRKANEGEAGYRFIGGFVDHADHSLEMAARREGMEETGGLTFSLPVHIGSAMIPDKRYRGTGQSIMTSMHYAIYVSGRPYASDDMAQLAWVDLQDIPATVIGIHQPLAKMLLAHINEVHA
jgi:bifunctional NMN adenylyltransferase/nudix hydrolase